MLRTVLSIAALATLAFVLTGCGGGGSKSDQDVQVKEVPKEKAQSPSTGHGLGKQGDASGGSKSGG